MKECEAWNWVFQHIKNRQEGEAEFGRFYIRLHDFAEIPEGWMPSEVELERDPDFYKQRAQEVQKPIHFGFAVGCFKQWCGSGSFAFKDTEEEATEEVIEQVAWCLRQVYREEENYQSNLNF